MNIKPLHPLYFYKYYVVGPSVTLSTFSTDFSFQNLIFWNLFKFSVTEIT